ncbi:XRE family transcriptional regulator [Kribbella sp. NBC_00709]|uniref:XRE family transcriptional regulator n=1 Tax=Kribbella sp. NBC_00709 TaxID=2975972 RepID=UPI002E2A22A2|nr:XRE family transcriptional regulator [Kribbella sp. NBC_00709]
MSAVNVGVLIEAALEAAGLSQRGLADATGISQSTLSRIIAGDRVAKLPEIVLIAQATGHTVAQLTGTSLVADRAQCAARATNDSGMDAMRQALLHFLELDSYLDDQAIPAAAGSGSQLMNAELDGQAAAEQFRAQHHLGVQPLGDLVAIIEQATGLDVAVLHAGPDEHGMTMRDPKRGAVFIGVARTLNPMRQRSTLAHELGHVLFGDWVDESSGDWSARTPIERRADAFARHLLIPQAGLAQFLDDRDPSSLATLSSIAQRFLVSPALAAIALHQGKFIGTSVKEDWKRWSTPQLAVRFGWTDHYHVLQADADQRRAPQRLLARAVSGYIEGVLPARAIATLRGISLDDVELELREADVVPHQPTVAWTAADDLPEVDIDLSDLDDGDASSEPGPGQRRHDR